MSKIIYRKLKEYIPGLEENVSLKEYTTYKIGGPADYFFNAQSKDDLLKALMGAKKAKVPVFIFGGGSNILVFDKGFRGLAIKVDILNIEIKDNFVLAGAGVGLTKLAYKVANESLSGLEWAVGIPSATIGGSIYGAAQAFGFKMADIVYQVEAIDRKTLKLKKFSKEQCRFSLKDSVFKKNKNLVIVSAILKLEKKDIGEIKSDIKEFLNYRKNNHPLDAPSAGSTFVNPERKIKNPKLLRKFPELIGYNERGVIPAGFLISRCGLSGKKIGKAQISEKHANFILNIGGAKSKDVLALIKLAQKQVKKNFGIKLETEIQFIGFK